MNSMSTKTWRSTFIPFVDYNWFIVNLLFVDFLIIIESRGFIENIFPSIVVPTELSFFYANKTTSGRRLISLIRLLNVFLRR